MNMGDLVDDGLGNIGFIVALGWIFPESGKLQEKRHGHRQNIPTTKTEMCNETSFVRYVKELLSGSTVKNVHY